MQYTDTRTKQEPEIISSSSAIDFIELMKPRVMSLVVFTAMVGMYLSPYHIHPVLAIISLLAISAGAGASGAMNQWIDRDIDAIMTRTRGRPIPSGRIEKSEAITFASVVAILSVIVLGLASNWLAAILLAITIFFYAVIYSVFLKRSTPQNIVIGGAAGALPPVIGWVSMTGNISIIPVFMFLLIFFWTPPHFWSLALIKADDYNKANIPMMPNIAGEKSTRLQIFVYSLLVCSVAITPVFLGFFGFLYSVVVIPLSLLFIGFSIFLIFKQFQKYDHQFFIYSIFYLFSVFLTLIFDKMFTGEVI